MVETQQILRLRRLLNASPEEVFDAWTDPASLSAWFFPGPIELKEVVCEPRVGGRISILMRGEAGLYPHDGEFVAVDRPHRLAFTWRSPGTGDANTLVTIDFVAQGGRTELTLSHEKLPDRDAMAKHEGGWTNVLDALADHLAR